MITSIEKNMVNAVIDFIKERSVTIFETETIPRITCCFIRKRIYSIIAKVNILLDENKRAIYIKMPFPTSDFRSENMHREYEVLCFYYKMFKEQNEYGVIKPLIYCNRPPALITEESIGETFLTVIRSKLKLITSTEDIDYLTSTCKNIGKFLRSFQSKWPIPDGLFIKKTTQINEISNFIRTQLSQCIANGLVDKKIIKSIQSYVDSITGSMLHADLKVAGMHADLCLSNIFLAKGKILFLDFGGFQIGPTCRDVANFLYSLDMLASNPIYRTKHINVLKKEFLEGYGWDERNENITLLKLYQIREIICGLVYESTQDQKDFINSLKLYKRRKLSEKLLLSAIKD